VVERLPASMLIPPMAPPGAGTRLSGLSALTATIAQGRSGDGLVGANPWHVGQTPLNTLAELYRHGLMVVIHGHADDGSTVETGGLLVAADLLVDTRRRQSARRPCAGQIRTKACGNRYG
jgi:hypothetical protein